MTLWFTLCLFSFNTEEWGSSNNLIAFTYIRQYQTISNHKFDCHSHKFDVSYSSHFKHMKRTESCWILPGRKVQVWSSRVSGNEHRLIDQDLEDDRTCVSHEQHGNEKGNTRGDERKDQMVFIWFVFNIQQYLMLYMLYLMLQAKSWHLGLQNPFESTTGTNDSLKIRYQNDADTVNFQCEGSDDRLCDFDLKLMQIESEPWDEKHVFLLTLSGWVGNSNICYLPSPIWGRFPFWLIFFKGVETTNYIVIYLIFHCCHSKWWVMDLAMYN